MDGRSSQGSGSGARVGDDGRADPREHHPSPLERRLALAERTVDASLRADLLAAAHDAVAADMVSDVQLSDELTSADSAHRRWQAVHRYVRAVPWRDDPTLARPQHWQSAVALARSIGDLDLMEWAVAMADRAHADASRQRRGDSADRATAAAATQAPPTYLAFLKEIANRRRKARVSLHWAQTARQNGWITCTTQTLGENLIALHAASVHSRDNPDYDGPVDGAYLKE